LLQPHAGIIKHPDAVPLVRLDDEECIVHDRIPFRGGWA
jgi:hypothetical protein